MTRRRPPQYDYICIRCGCACDEAGTRHLGGGPGMKACGKPPHPKLRSQFEAEAKNIVQHLKDQYRNL